MLVSAIDYSNAIDAFAFGVALLPIRGQPPCVIAPLVLYVICRAKGAVTVFRRTGDTR